MKGGRHRSTACLARWSAATALPASGLSEQTWRAYALHMLLFQLVLTVFTYALLRFQAVLPLNRARWAPLAAMAR
jgi:K+-transporting ATPase A subunit